MVRWNLNCYSIQLSFFVAVAVAAAAAAVAVADLVGAVDSKP